MERNLGSMQVGAICFDAISIQKKLWYLFVSIFLNTLGGALTVIANVGVSPWSAAGINMEYYFSVSLGTALLISSVILHVIVILVEKNIPVRRIIFDFLYMFLYSYGVDSWLYVLKHWHVESVAMNYVIFFVGMVLVAISISIYVKLDIVLHPIDLFYKMLRDRFFGGSVVKAQLINYGIPIFLAVFFGLLNHNIEALSIGTIIYFLIFGKILATVDKELNIKLIDESNEKQSISV